jgi:threonine dehydrogenase-like Zn-dependent dehydrogenase
MARRADFESCPVGQGGTIAAEKHLPESPMNKVRIAVVGAGLIGLRHIEEIGKSRGAVLSAIVDVSPRAAEVARRAA